MILERSHNTVRIMRAGIVSKIANLVFPFLSRAVFVRTLGAEYFGVNSLFTSILSVLSLTELGFGSAVVFSMYKAIADDDEQLINALLFFYRKVYRYIGTIILSIGLMLIPFLPHLTKGTYPADINPLVVYLVFLLNTVASYFLFAYLNSLLFAFQRTDINTMIVMIMNIGANIVQIVLLLTTNNYYFYLIILPVFTVLTNICTALVVKKVFPQYRPYGEIDSATKAEIKEKVNGLMVEKLCGTSRNSFDSIFISLFLGLTEIAKYNNYLYIIGSVAGVMGIASSAVLAGAGNSVATETQSKNYRDMMRINFIYMWASGWCSICLICLYQPFIKIWVGDKMLLPMSSVVLLCIYFYILKMGDIRYVYACACGLWWQNRYLSLAEAGTNIILNYLLGKNFGINGIIGATLISLFFFNFCCSSQIVYRYYFTDQKVHSYFSFHAKCVAITTLVCGANWLLCSIIPDTLAGFVGKTCVCCFVPNILYFLIYRKTKKYKEAMPWVLRRVGLKVTNPIYRFLITD